MSAMTLTKPVVFRNESLNIELQAMKYEDKPVFFAVEVAKALGYANPHEALQDNCKSLIKLNSSQTLELDLGFKPKGIILLTEPDLYRLILRSKLPSAEKVQDWVCEEVLPSIRQTGGYQLPQHNIPQTLSEALMLAANLAKENEQLTGERDHAIRTKSQISNKREATACQRNSVLQRITNQALRTAEEALREREEMAARFGASKEWASAEAVCCANGKLFGWKALRHWMDEHDPDFEYLTGYPTAWNPDRNRREVLYPRQAWLDIYGIDIAALF